MEAGEREVAWKICVPYVKGYLLKGTVNPNQHIKMMGSNSGLSIRVHDIPTELLGQ